jgi:hypothetical protein
MSLTVSSALCDACLSRCLIVSLLGVTISRKLSLTQSAQIWPVGPDGGHLRKEGESVGRPVGIRRTSMPCAIPPLEGNLKDENRRWPCGRVTPARARRSWSTIRRGRTSSEWTVMNAPCGERRRGTIRSRTLRCGRIPSKIGDPPTRLPPR